MDAPPILEIERECSAPEIVGVTFEVYRWYPWLFPVLALAVVVPYQVIVLLATETGPTGGVRLSFLDTMLLLAIQSFLVTPLISALHVHAVDDVRENRAPRIGSVARRGLITLPVVVAAAIISSLGIAVGFVALIVPGVILALRWSVVAQAAALEGKGWTDALRRSHELTKGNYGHIFGTWFLLGLVGGVPLALFGVVTHHSTAAVPFILGLAIAVFARSFTALGTGLLFFDLKARRQVAPARSSAPPPPQSSSGRIVPPSGHPLDPASWSDEERPAGWYVDPDSPWRMRYWAADGVHAWSKRTAKTPKATQEEWKDLRWVRES